MRTEIDDYLSERLEAAGMKVERVKVGRRRLQRIQTGSDRELAQILWSILDRDRCFITGQRPYVTLYGTRYIDRLLAKNVEGEYRQTVFGIVALAPLLATVIVGIVTRLAGFDVASQGRLVALVVTLGLVWGLYYLYESPFGRSETFEFRALGYRFMLGLGIGGLWSWMVNSPSLDQVLGALAVFVLANLVWMGTWVYDRWEFDNELNEVGGRMSDLDAHNRLDRILESRRK